MKLPRLDYSKRPVGRDPFRFKIEAATVDIAPRKVGGVIIPVPEDREQLRKLRSCLGVSLSQIQRIMGVSAHAANTMFSPRKAETAIRKSSIRNYTAALRLGVAELQLDPEDLARRVAEYHVSIHPEFVKP